MKIPNYCWSSNKGELHIHTIDTLGKLKEDTIVVKWKGFEKYKAEDFNAFTSIIAETILTKD